MPPQQPPTEPDLLGFREWFHEVCKGKPANWLPSIRDAFVAGWHRGQNEAYADMEKRHE